MYLCCWSSLCVCPFDFPLIKLSKGFPMRLWPCILLEIDAHYSRMGSYINLSHFLYRVDIFTSCQLHVRTVINCCHYYAKYMAVGLILIICDWTVALAKSQVLFTPGIHIRLRVIWSRHSFPCNKVNRGGQADWAKSTINTSWKWSIWLVHSILSLLKLNSFVWKFTL